MMHAPRNVLRLASFTVLLAFVPYLAGQELELWEQEQSALRQAAERVAANVVRLELLGGRVRADRVLLGDAPSTGLVVSKDGYIVASDFILEGQPSGIVAITADGRRLPAVVTAKDAVARLVLLKVESPAPWPEVQAAPLNEAKVGAWAVAVGRTFEARELNLSVGILSAVDRVWGRAVQTDAKISPSNYGGPLVDVQGRVIGILTPFSTDADRLSGYDWYDSGIGFAAPFEPLLARLEGWKNQDLKAGLLGVRLKPDGLFDPCVLLSAQKGGPAAAAGFKSDDVVIRLNDRPVRTLADLKFAMGPRYAGETVEMEVQRGEQTFAAKVTLVDQLPKFRWPFLGIALARPSDEAGMRVLSLANASPAANVGIQIGDTLVSIDGRPLENLASLDSLLAEKEIDEEAVLLIRRNETETAFTCKLADLPDEMTPASETPSVPGAKLTEQSIVRLPEYPNEGVFYTFAEAAPNSPPAKLLLPVAGPSAEQKEGTSKSDAEKPDENAAQDNAAKGTDADASENASSQETEPLTSPPGVLIWFPPSEIKPEHTDLKSVKQAAEEAGLFLFVAAAADAQRWQREDLEYVKRAVGPLLQAKGIAKDRIVLGGSGAGATVAGRLALANPNEFRGLVVWNGLLPGDMQAPAIEFAQRFSLLLTWQADSVFAPRSRLDAQAWQEAGHHVTLQIGVKQGSEEELKVLRDWLRSLAYR